MLQPLQLVKCHLRKSLLGLVKPTPELAGCLVLNWKQHGVFGSAYRALEKLQVRL